MPLVAAPGGCEEASVHSVLFYIPCNTPAARRVWSPRDSREYRMCAPCAFHNVHNRGCEDRGEWAA